ncbi:hypothetical protein F5Y03DRAFT_392120 [Xylaria venustula]|nr:hypothetical protein F5Y03DRAFT_392120 [Xylaria venustula]
MGDNKRKRNVSSCIPCYTRKQKCNRRYPCDHCTKRRRPEQCGYYPSQASKRALRHLHVAGTDDSPERAEFESSLAQTASADLATPSPKEKTQLSSVAELFGYSEGSKSNTLALVQRLGIFAEGKDTSLPAEVIPEIQRALGGIPSRPILDVLLQYFVTEVNWIHQILYPPWFLTKYQEWWGLNRPYSVEDIEFAILFLRVCWYTSHVLPSESYKTNNIRGVGFLEIRKACTTTADIFESICARLDERGSLMRVQHLAFSGLGSLAQGQMSRFWASLGGAVRVAQRIGMHLEAPSGGDSTDRFEKELRRRTFCSLYILDSILSSRMDHMPLFPQQLPAGNMPRMHLVPEGANSKDAPDMFAERILQVKLVNFWKRQNLRIGPDYDGLVVQERYDKFCTEFLLSLPSAFSLEPDTFWDSRLPKLCFQRQVLHIAIFDSLCFNFRPALLQDPAQIESLPGYKKVLLSSHQKTLASAALKVLETVSLLHDMMGGAYSRYPGMIMATFEAAVPLLCLCAEAEFLGDTGTNQCVSTGAQHPLSTAMGDLTRDKCIQATKDAVKRLQVFADVSKMAHAASQALVSLIAKVEDPPTHPSPQCDILNTIDPTVQFMDAWKGYDMGNSGDIFTMGGAIFDSSSTFTGNWGSLDGISDLFWN